MKTKRIFIILALLLLVSLMMAGIFFYRQTENLGRSVVVSVAENSAKSLATAVKSFLEPFVSNSRFMADMFAEEGLVVSSNNKVAPFAAALVAGHAPLSGVMISDASGPLFILAKRNANLYVCGKEGVWHKTTRKGEIGEVTDAPFQVRFHAVSSAVADLESAPDSHGASGRVFWSPSFLDNDGMSVSVTLDEPAGSSNETDRDRQVLSLSFSLESMQDVVATATTSPNESVFILASPKSGVDATLGHEVDVFGKKAVLVPLVGKEKKGMLVEGAKKIMELAGADEPTLAVPVHGGESFVGFARLGESVESAYLGVVIPKEDLAERFSIEQSDLNRMGLAFLGAFVLAAVMLLFMYRLLLKRSSPEVATQNVPVTHLIHQGESEFVEFKSTLRVNLKTEKNDKRIEMACLKTVAAFLNSHGGTLLVGVSDSGEILGLAADGFSDADHILRHFSNIFDQSIGPVHRNQLTTSIVDIKGSNVLRIDCRPAESPVFVKTPEDDVFYVRTGPATKRLKMTEALEYMKTRFQTV